MDELIKLVEDIIRCPVPDDVVENFREEGLTVESFSLLSDDELNSLGLKMGPRKLILSWMHQQQSVNNSLEVSETSTSSDNRPLLPTLQESSVHHSTLHTAGTSSQNTDHFTEQQRKLFIGGIHHLTTEETLRNFYEKWGEIAKCVVIRDPPRRRWRSRRFAYITYSNVKSVEKALNSQPHVIDGQNVDPKRALPKEKSQVKKVEKAQSSTDEGLSRMGGSPRGGYSAGYAGASPGAGAYAGRYAGSARDGYRGGASAYGSGAYGGSNSTGY